MLHIFFFIAFSGTQGRIQDFAQGGGRDLKSLLTSRGARLLPREAQFLFARKILGGPPPP